MRISPLFWQGVRAVVAALLMVCLAPGCKPAVKPASPAKPAPPKAAAAVSDLHHAAVDHLSVFEELMPPKGRDPFFPNSHRRDVVPVMATSPNMPPPPTSALVLKGVIGSPNHRMALINSSILEVGEEEAVRVPGGHVKVKCLEIGEDYAVIRAEGESQPKRLELNKKGF
jgi:hypothetical protein